MNRINLRYCSINVDGSDLLWFIALALCLGMLLNLVRIKIIVLIVLLGILILIVSQKNLRSILIHLGLMLVVFLLGYLRFSLSWLEWSHQVLDLEKRPVRVEHAVQTSPIKSHRFGRSVLIGLKSQYYDQPNYQLQIWLSKAQHAAGLYCPVSYKLRCHGLTGTANGLMPDGLWYGYSHHILGSCRVVKDLHSSKPCQLNLIQESRVVLMQGLDHVKNLQYRGIFKALIVGDQSGIGSDLWHLFRSTGTSHLVAVSGLHIGLIAQIIGCLGGWIWSLALRWLWQIPKSYFIWSARLLGGAGYMLMSGCGYSSQRAMMMLALYHLALFIGYKPNMSFILALSLMLLLILQPFMFLSAGFWLSVMAVGSLIVGSDVFKDGFWGLKILGRGQISVWFGMLPAQALLVMPVGWLMPLVNGFAIPLFSILIVPGCFVLVVVGMVSTRMMALGFRVLDGCMQYYLIILHHLVEWFGRGYFFPVVSGGQMLLLCAMVGVIFYRGRTKCKAGILAGLSLVYCLLKPGISHGVFRWVVFDVGQGLAVFVQTKHHTLLFDTGNKGRGRSVIVPYLRLQSIKKLDDIVISHGDIDHSGGLREVLGVFPADKVLTSDLKAIAYARHKELCKAGEQWQWDGVHFVFLNSSGKQRDIGNNQSCVLMVSGAFGRLLLPGDIEYEGEEKLLRTLQPSQLQADVLVAAHHGSQSSSSRAFIHAVRPRVVIVSAGPYHRFHHPSKQVIKLFHDLGVRVFNTHTVGAVSAMMNTRYFLVQTARILLL